MQYDKSVSRSEIESYKKLFREFSDREYPQPRGWSGRGIVICGGGERYFTCAWVCIHMLRKLGCILPIELWYLEASEMSREMIDLLAPLRVKTVDAAVVRQNHPARILGGWELKAYAIMHSSFEEVLFLDADNVPVVNPEFLFDTAQYKETGAIFWPDFENLTRDNPIWEICGVEYRNEPEVESGQLMMDKRRCWKALNIAMHLNEHSDFYYRLIYGDKDTFHMAWRSLGQAYSMTKYPLYPIGDTRCHYDFEGRRIFQHRNTDKWSLDRKNKEIEGFQLEKDCFEFLERLRNVWTRRIPFFDLESKSEREKRAIERLIFATFVYRRVGYDQRHMSFLPEGAINEGADGCEKFWNVSERGGMLCLDIFSSDRRLTCRLKICNDGVWRGEWVNHEKMGIELRPRSHGPRTLLIQQGDSEHREMLGLTYEWHENYAKRHDMDYWVVNGRVQVERMAIWDKIRLIREALHMHYEFVAWLDADVMITDVNEDIRNAMSEFNYVGMCKHPLPWDDQSWHFNAGVIFIRNCELTKEFFEQVWSAGPCDHPWQEQARMMEWGRRMPKVLRVIDNKWNALDGINPSPHPVIKAWHNQPARLLAMADYIKTLKQSLPVPSDPVQVTD